MKKIILLKTSNGVNRKRNKNKDPTVKSFSLNALNI
jgi:hypothetical protein